MKGVNVKELGRLKKVESIQFKDVRRHFENHSKT